jgi:hypothetical protein
VEFREPGEDGSVVASARWDNGTVEVTAGDQAVRDALTHAYRHTPVVTDDASYRRLGTHGEVMIQPGDLAWFRAASQVRASAETGLIARFLPGATPGGYDPAAGYRRFEESIERLDDQAAG